MPNQQTLLPTLHELRDACGDDGLRRFYDELGVAGIGEISDVAAAARLAETMIQEATQKRCANSGITVRAQLAELADRHYAKLRGEITESESE